MITSPGGYPQGLGASLFTAPSTAQQPQRMPPCCSCHSCGTHGGAPVAEAASPRFRNADLPEENQANSQRVLSLERHPLVGAGIRVVGGNAVGIFVSEVNPQSPAAEAGIRPGDEILTVNTVLNTKIY